MTRLMPAALSRAISASLGWPARQSPLPHMKALNEAWKSAGVTAGVSVTSAVFAAAVFFAASVFCAGLGVVASAPESDGPSPDERINTPRAQQLARIVPHLFAK